jgi:D-alanyl-D-alanine carboxypeptidase (penicillin-binding protein 5/6)
VPGRLALAALLALACAAARAEDPFPGTAAAYLVIVDGAARWEHRADAPRAPASLAKLMGALLVVRDGDLEGEVAVPAAAARARGARLGLQAGERAPAQALLAAMLVGSANDACLALALRGGSAAQFVARMNEGARALGLRATRFADPCGFDARGQRSTARELARLAEAFLADARLAALVRRREAEVRTSGGRILTIKSTNPLLEYFPGALGVKTGHTRQAGYNLIALAERGGRRVLLVMLGAHDRWWDAHGILERALAR